MSVFIFLNPPTVCVCRPPDERRKRGEFKWDGAPAESVGEPNEEGTRTRSHFPVFGDVTLGRCSHRRDTIQGRQHVLHAHVLRFRERDGGRRVHSVRSRGDRGHVQPSRRGQFHLVDQLHHRRPTGRCWRYQHQFTVRFSPLPLPLPHPQQPRSSRDFPPAERQPHPVRGDL